MISYGRKLKVAIIGNIATSGSAGVFLRKYLRVLLPFSELIYVISDWIFQSSDSKVEVITSIRAITKRFVGKHSVFAKLIRFLLAQLIICVNLLGPARYVHVVIVFPIPMILPILLAKLMGKKVVPFAAAKVKVNFTPKEGLGGKFLTNTMELVKHIVFTLSDRIIVESSSLIYSLNLNKYRNKLDVGSTFVDIDVFRPQIDVNNRRKLVGYIGNLTESKGVKQFVKSTPLVLEKNPEVEFFIGGTGSCYPEIRQMILNYKLLDKVELIGWIPNSYVPKYLNRLKLLVLPSVSEGVPNIVIEAMACGTPVLATCVGGIPDIIKDGETGFILEDDFPESIARNIVGILESDNLESVSKKARHLIETKYSYEAALERYCKILQSI